MCVPIGETPCGFLNAELLSYTLAIEAAHFRPSRPVHRQLGDRCGDGFGLLWRHYAATLAIDESLGIAADVRRNRR